MFIRIDSISSSFILFCFVSFRWLVCSFEILVSLRDSFACSSDLRFQFENANRKWTFYEILYLFAALYTEQHMLLSFWLLFLGPVSVFSMNVYYDFIHFVSLIYARMKRAVDHIKSKPKCDWAICIFRANLWTKNGTPRLNRQGEGRRTDEGIDCAIKPEINVDYREFCECFDQSWLVLLQCIALKSAFYGFQFCFNDFWTFRHNATKFLTTTAFKRRKMKGRKKRQ